MKPPRSLKITELEVGTGRVCVPGDTALVHYEIRRPKGDVLSSSNEKRPSEVDVGRRDFFVGIEYGLLGMRVGGRRSIVVPPHLMGYLPRIYDLPSGAMVVIELHLIDLPQKWDPDMESRLARQPKQ